MDSGNIMVRLIDLVFILLFGFIAISQFSTAKEVQPPKSSESTAYVDNDSMTVIVVCVLADGSFPINDGSVVMPDSTSLHHFLEDETQKATRDEKMLGVRIRARFDSPLHRSMAVAQICKSLGVSKGLDVMRVESDG